MEEEEEEGKSLSLILLIFAVVIQSRHMMLHCKQVHFSPDLFGGGDNDDCLVMEEEDGSMLSLVCCAVRHCHMLFHHTHILYSPVADVYTCSGMDTSNTIGDLS